MSYIKILKWHFKVRNRKNENYSKNAFARDIGLSAPRLSQILSMKSGLSASLIEEICKRLQLPTDHCEIFHDSVVACHARSQMARERAIVRLKKHRNFQLL